MACDRTAVLSALPHRPPFLFVDRIVERGPGRIVAEWTAREDLECFAGHYPGAPLLPGVLIAEFAFQAASILLASEPAEPPNSGIPVLTRIQDARFRRMVRPGETLRADVREVERLGNAAWLEATVTSGEAKVATLRFTLARAEEGA